MLKPFFVWRKKKLRKIHPEQVLGLSTEGNYTRIYLADETDYMVRASLSNALKKLPRDMFIRTHRSHAVSVYYMDHIEKDILLIGQAQIPIGKQYYQSVREKLNIIE